MATPQGLKFLHSNIYGNAKKYSSQEPLARMHLCLAWIILGAREFKFLQIKSLGSCMAPPQRLKRLHSNI